MIRLAIIVVALIVLCIAIKKNPALRETIRDAVGVLGSFIRFLR